MACVEFTVRRGGDVEPLAQVLVKDWYRGQIYPWLAARCNGSGPLAGPETACP